MAENEHLSEDAAHHKAEIKRLTAALDGNAYGVTSNGHYLIEKQS